MKIAGFIEKMYFEQTVYRFPVFNITDWVWYIYSVKTERVICENSI